MSARDAAEEVLRQAGTPLHVADLTKRILESGLWSADGKTPQATVAARISTDIKKRGSASPFVRVAPNTFGLRALGAKAVLGKSKASRGRPAAMSFTNAAEKVLAQSGDKKPLHYREITKRALAKRWLNTEGRTPEATMYAQILSEIKRYKKRGEQPRFVQHGRGYVGLSKWMGRGLAFEIEQHNKRVRDQFLKRLRGIAPDEFEELIGELLAEMGFDEIEVTRHRGDGGIDVRGVLVVGEVVKTRMAVQAKRWKKGSNVQAPTVQQLRGSLGAHEQGLIILDLSEE